MDKVIIDGIDISECPLFDKKTGCYHTFNGECVKDSCAVYKWLLEHKRLQEENKELEQDLHEVENACSCFESGNAYLLKENERLKAKVEKLDKMTGIFSARLCEKYRQALQEIREIILEMCGEQCGACFIEMCNRKCRYAKIQNKINEVIGAEE